MADSFDRLARQIIDTGAAVSARMIRTGRHQSAGGVGISLPRQIGAGGESEPSFNNPMENTGSLIVGGESGAPEEIAAGGEGAVLTIIDGVPAWTTIGLSWSVLTNGDPADPQIIFADGDVVMVEY